MFESERGGQSLERIVLLVLVVLDPKADSSVVQVERTFWRRKWSWIVFCRMRWNSSGSSPAGLSAYFSVSFSMASCTMSSAASSSRTANIACLKARRSTLGEERGDFLSGSQCSLPQTWIRARL